MAETGGREGLLVDVDTGILRPGRVLVQHTPEAILFLGSGPRAERLRRFAFAETGEHIETADPFIDRCRRLAEAVESGQLAKARHAGVPPTVLAITDRTLRRFAIAEALAKAGYDPDEPRDDQGRWTSGGASVREGTAADVVQIAATLNGTFARKEHFVEAHLVDAEKGARELGIPVENILGLSALESQWGEARFAAEGNNYFGIHYPAPFAAGYMLAREGRTKVATFASYAESLQSFIAISGSLVRGKSDPEAFAAALQNSRKFGITNEGSKVSTYVEGVAGTIRGLRLIIERGRI